MKRRDLLEALRTIVQLKKNLADEFGLEQRVFAYADILNEIDSIQEMQGDLDGRIARAGRGEHEPDDKEKVPHKEKRDSAQTTPVGSTGPLAGHVEEEWAVLEPREKSFH